MVDVTAIAGALASLKAAKDIAQAMVGLRDAQTFQEKLIEFQSRILDAQSSAFAAQEERTTLIERVRELERQVADFETWKTEKQRYELVDIGGGTFAYIVKAAMRGTEPPHYVCTNCFHDGKAAILQHVRANIGHVIACPSCKTKTVIARSAYRPPQ